MKKQIHWILFLAIAFLSIMPKQAKANLDGVAPRLIIDGEWETIGSNWYPNTYGYISLDFTCWNEKTGPGDYNMYKMKIWILHSNGTTKELLLSCSRLNTDDPLSVNYYDQVAGTLTASNRWGSGDWRYTGGTIKYNAAIYNALASYSDGQDINFYYEYSVDEDDMNDHHEFGTKKANYSYFRRIQTPTLSNVNFNTSTNAGFTINYTRNGWESINNSTLVVRKNGTNTSNTTISGTSYSFTDESIFTGKVTYDIIHRAERNGEYVYSNASANSVTFNQFTQPTSVTTNFDACKKYIKLNITMPTFVAATHDATTPFTIVRYKSNSIDGTYIKDKEFQTTFSTLTNINIEDSEGLEDGMYYQYKVKRHPWSIDYKSITTNKVLYSTIAYTNYTFVSNPDSSVIAIPYKLDNYESNIYTSAKVFLFENETTEVASKPVTSQVDTFFIKVDANYLTSKHTYKLAVKINDNNCTLETPEFVVLPYSLVKIFTSVYDSASRRVVLEWEIDSILDEDHVSGDHFEIEKATNAGFSSSQLFALVEHDNNPKYTLYDTVGYGTDATFYYRIRRTHTVKEWDWVHHVKTTSVKAANLNMNTPQQIAPVIKLTPNPATEKVTISMQENTGEVLVRIIDQTGKVVKTQELMKTGVIFVQDLSKGMYLLQLVNKNWSKTEKLIIE